MDPIRVERERVPDVYPLTLIQARSPEPSPWCPRPVGIVGGYLLCCLRYNRDDREIQRPTRSARGSIIQFLSFLSHKPLSQSVSLSTPRSVPSISSYLCVWSPGVIGNFTPTPPYFTGVRDSIPVGMRVAPFTSICDDPLSHTLYTLKRPRTIPRAR